MTKVLLIEDDPAIRGMYQTMFTKHGFKVATATNGQEGLDQAAKDLPAVILCDVEMPVLNGIETVKKLKADKATAKIPIIMLTNRADDAMVKDSIEFGANSYFIKSDLTPADIVAMVQGLLSRPDETPKP